MKVKSFRLQNYKKVLDSGWISCEKLTAFVGKNESGKSALFRGLSKLNPSDGEVYNDLKEYPRRFYSSDYTPEAPAASVEFELTEIEREKLIEICPILSKVETITCIRFYSWKLELNFNPEPEIPQISFEGYSNFLDRLMVSIRDLSAPEGKGEALQQIKTQLLNEIKNRINSLNPQITPQQIDAQINIILDKTSAQANEEWQKESMTTLIDEINDFKSNLSIIFQVEKAREWLKSIIPQFIYFDRYDVIDSAIHIPSFISEMKADPTAPRVRATKCLFEHVGLDINEINKLDPNQPNQTTEQLRFMADKRAIQMSSASNSMTDKFSDWWEQRKHKFRYQIDGPFFRVWVSDDLDPSEIELDQRSLGLQYFFSFYVIFLVEATGAHQNSILLLDEAGIHMHGTAQGSIIKFLEKLSEKNQTMYSTHSPFMIEGDHLERVRVVFEGEDGSTKVSEDVWPRDKDALFPLQAALGYSISQTLFFGKYQIIVEGITDYWIFKALNDLLKEQGNECLDEDLIIVPCGGVRNLIPLASLLVGHEVEIGVILDGDEPGRRKGKQLQDKLLSEDKGRCLFIGDFTSFPEGELEDLFDEDFYLSAVNESYNIKLTFNTSETTIKHITKRISAAFTRLNLGKFEKWRPAKVILNWIGNNTKSLPQTTLDRFAQIFKTINTKFTRTK